MRKQISAAFGLVLVGSLALNAIYLYEDIKTPSVHDVPRWNSEESEILERAYRELVSHDEVPLGVYPYEIQGNSYGYTIGFQDYDSLQLRATLFGRGDSSDGCVFYHFSRDIQLTNVTERGYSPC